MNGTLVEVSKNEMPHMVYPGVTIAGTELAIEDANAQQIQPHVESGYSVFREC